MIEVELDSGALHLLEIFRIDSLSTEPIDYHAHSGARPFGQSLCESFTDFPSPIDKRLERDGSLGTLNRLQHRGKDLIAVEKRCHPVALQNLGTE